jgi:3-oxoacyl-[acyl-carrier protein] reductase
MEDVMGKLDKKVALITGGARGIGRAIALAFAMEGADIGIGDLIDAEPVAQEIRGMGREALTVKADVSKKEDVDRLIHTTVARFQRIDILVNNAGISRRVKFLEMKEEDWDSVLAVNLRGVFLCTQAAAREMVRQGHGKIINMGSIYGLNSVVPGQAQYGVSKAGVIQLTRFCALELGPHGINVNAIAPGMVVTDILSTGRSEEQVKQRIEGRKKITPLGKVGFPEDIAKVALFLASEDSSLITGQVIVADGGPAKIDEL